jgi:hypothetical protein
MRPIFYINEVQEASSVDNQPNRSPSSGFVIDFRDECSGWLITWLSGREPLWSAIIKEGFYGIFSQELREILRWERLLKTKICLTIVQDKDYNNSLLFNGSTGTKSTLIHFAA